VVLDDRRIGGLVCIRGADLLPAFVQTINRFVRGRSLTFN
jgi:hypothetical protein